MMIEGDVLPDTRSCARCGLTMDKRRNLDCNDCESIARFVPINNARNPLQFDRSSFEEIDAGYEVSLHYAKLTEKCPSRLTLNTMGIPYVTYRADPDPFELAYAMGLHEGDAPIEYPIVLITRHGEYLEHWEGFRLADLNRIPADRKRVLKIEDAQDSPRVPIDLKEAA